MPVENRESGPQFIKTNKMAKYYFQKHDEDCYTRQYHLDYMQENGLTEMKVFEAIRDVGVDYFYCKYHCLIGTTDDCCGKYNCEQYEPRNKISGICKHYGYCYSQGKEVILKRK